MPSYISGQDRIVATLLPDPSVKREEPLRTRGPGFEPMFGSANCLGGPVIAFPPFGQQNYDCFYWGTHPTNVPLSTIANTCKDRLDVLKQGRFSAQNLHAELILLLDNSL